MSSKRFKLIFNILTLSALAILVIVSWSQIIKGLEQIGAAKLTIVLLMIPMQLVNYYSIGKVYQTYFKAIGHNLSMKSMYKVALELNFVNHIFPSGGVAGFSYFGLRMRRQGVPVSSTTLAQAIRFGLTFLSFLLLLFLGMFLLSFGRHGGGVAMFIGLSIAFVTLFGTIVAVYIVSNEHRVKALTAFLPKVANVLLRHLTRKKNTIDVERIERLFTDLHKDYLFVSKDWRKLKAPFMWAIMVNATEIATAYLAYIALGHMVNPGAVILAYAVASFAGLISILPGGIGVYETLMIAVLATAGVPKALALSATLIYRIFCMLIFLPIGFVLYQLALRKGQAEAPSHEQSRADLNTD